MVNKRLLTSQLQFRVEFIRWSWNNTLHKFKLRTNTLYSRYAFISNFISCGQWNLLRVRQNAETQSKWLRTLSEHAILNNSYIHIHLRFLFYFVVINMHMCITLILSPNKQGWLHFFQIECPITKVSIAGVASEPQKTKVAGARSG